MLGLLRVFRHIDLRKSADPSGDVRYEVIESGRSGGVADAGQSTLSLAAAELEGGLVREGVAESEVVTIMKGLSEKGSAEAILAKVGPRLVRAWIGQRTSTATW
jgi:hypothetical protein